MHQLICKSRRWQHFFLNPLCLLGMLGLCGVCSAAEPLTYSEVIKKTTQVIDSAMEIYAGAPDVPRPVGEDRSPQVLQWYADYQEAQVAALREMDNSVVVMIESGFEFGLSLSGIRERTSNCVTWVEWPKEYSNLHGEPRGISDYLLSEEDWASATNAVVVIHQVHTIPGCVFRRLRPPIPIEGGHSFRGKAAIFRSAATRVVQLSMSSYRIALRESSFVPFSFAWTLP
jgi:hypothetical protein